MKDFDWTAIGINLIILAMFGGILWNSNAQKLDKGQIISLVRDEIKEYSMNKVDAERIKVTLEFLRDDVGKVNTKLDGLAERLDLMTWVEQPQKNLTVKN